MRSAAAQLKFETFHAANPAVYEKLKEFALLAKSAGRSHFGIRQIWERLRWYFAFEVLDQSSPYKLNNDYTPFYARKLMAEVPELADFFETRERRGTLSTVHRDDVELAAAA